MADSLWGQHMKAGFMGAARGRSGRHLRFVTTIVALAGINIWLWVRVVDTLANGNIRSELPISLAALASTVSLVVAIALWRNPISKNVRTMTTPALRQALATHHAGHAVATYLNDPTRLRRIDLSEPCNLYRPEVPVVTQTALRSEMGIALAGMTAEEVFAGESGSHAATDLAHATDIGVDMVGRFGMAGSLVSLDSSRQSRRSFTNRVLDDARTRKELEALVREIKREAVKSMLEHRRVVITLRDTLMRQSRIDADHARKIIDDALRERRSDDTVLVDLHVVSNLPLAGEM